MFGFYTLSVFPMHLDQDQWSLQISKVPQEKPAGLLDQRDSAKRLSKWLLTALASLGDWELKPPVDNMSTEAANVQQCEGSLLQGSSTEEASLLLPLMWRTLPSHLKKKKGSEERLRGSRPLPLQALSNSFLSFLSSAQCTCSGGTLRKNNSWELT